MRNTDEAETVLGAGADIIDLKDPGRGTLGALDLDAIWAFVSHVDGRVPVSATVGDLHSVGNTSRSYPCRAGTIWLQRDRC